LAPSTLGRGKQGKEKHPSHILPRLGISVLEKKKEKKKKKRNEVRINKLNPLGFYI